MQRWIRPVSMAVLGAVLLASALFVVSRLGGPTLAQRAALEAMQPKPWPAGRNAAAALWLIEYDVPESEQDRIAADDVARAARAIAQGELDWSGTLRSAAEGRYPRLFERDGNPTPCSMRDPDCLTKVRANLAAHAAQQARLAPLLARTRALDGYDFHRGPIDHPETLLVMLPTLSPLMVQRTQHALDFVEGRVDIALQGLCSEIVTWRRLGGDSDTLLVSMIGDAIVDGGSDLFLQMLDGLPAQHPLPTACSAAFAPPQLHDLQLCKAMRGEFRYTTRMLQLELGKPDGSGALAALTHWFTYDPVHTAFLQAESLAPACAAEIDGLLARDVAVAWPLPSTSGRRLECIANRVGCNFADVAGPNFTDYFHRRQDTGAKLRAVNTFLTLRNTAADPHSLREQVESLGANDAAGQRPLRLSDDGSALVVAAYSEHHQPSLSIPLPAVLRQRLGTTLDQSTGSHSAK